MNSHTRDIVEVFQCFEIGIKLKVISFQTFLVQTTEIMSIFKSNCQLFWLKVGLKVSILVDIYYV